MLTLWQTPRALLVNIDAPTLKLQVAVLHGLDSAYGEEEIERWWSTASDQLAKAASAKFPLSVLLDANAEMRGIEGHGVGQLAHGKQNMASKHVGELLDKHGLLLSNTTLDQGDKWGTWLLNPATWKHIDYICVPWSHGARLKSAESRQDVATATKAKQNNFPVQVVVGVERKQCKEERQFGINRAAFKLPDVRDAMLAEVRAVPPLPQCTAELQENMLPALLRELGHKHAPEKKGGSQSGVDGHAHLEQCPGTRVCQKWVFQDESGPSRDRLVPS